MANETAVRMVTENREGLRCFSYLTFHMSGSGRDREVFPLPLVIFECEWFGVLSEKRNNETAL